MTTIRKRFGPDPRPTTTGRFVVAPVLLIVAIAALLPLTGCVSVLSSSSDASSSRASEPMTTPVSSGAGVPSTLESSIALLRSPGEDGEIRGSAVVIDSKGYLIAAERSLSGDVEVVLPDGQVYRPLVAAREPAAGVVLLKVPASRLVPVRFSTERLGEGSEVIATGYDHSSAAIGQIGGQVVAVHEDSDNIEYRVRGSLFIDTDISRVASLVGGVLSDGRGGFAGMLVPGETPDGRKTMSAVSSWLVLGWLDARHERETELAGDADDWESLSLPDGWSAAYPDGWSASISDDRDDSYRAEVRPGDLDATLQLGIAVEPNEYGTDVDAFTKQLLDDYTGAKVWGVERIGGQPLARFSVAQEGAYMDIAYLLGEDSRIAISMTSGFDPMSDHDQAEQTRLLFDAVLGTLEREGQ